MSKRGDIHFNKLNNKLRYQIDKNCFHIDDSNKIDEWPIPINKIKTVSFMGIIQFIAKSIEGYAKIAQSLTRLD